MSNNKRLKLKNIFQFEAKIGWAEILAAIALVLASMTYVSESPLKQMLQKRPRIQILEIESLNSPLKEFHVRLKNIGKFPVNDLQVIFSTLLLKQTDPLYIDAPRVQMIPLFPYDMKVNGAKAYMTITRPISPDTELDLFIFGEPLDMTLITEYGDITDLGSLLYQKEHR